MKFSVVIPLYNKAPYVAKAIQSVLDQTFLDYELIIVDDGSTDASAEIAAKAIEGHAQCRLVTQENAGVSMARNNGVAVSQGEYLCFLDADDWWDPRFLEEMVGLIAAFPEAGVYGTNYTIVNDTKRKTRVSPIGVEPSFEKGYINYCQVYAKTLAMPLTSISVAVPRMVFDEMKGFPMGVELGEDFLLWIHIALKYKVAFLNKPLAFYNQDVDEASRGTKRLCHPDRHMIWHMDDLEPEERRNADFKVLADALRVNSLIPYYLSKEYRPAAVSELGKVDWSRQPAKAKREYHRPVGLLKLKYALLKFGSKVKIKLIGILHGTLYHH